MVKTIWTWILNISASWSIIWEDYRSAKDRYEELRRISEQRNGYNHIKTVPILYQLARCYHHVGGADNFRHALIVYENALGVAEASSAENKDFLIGQIANEMGNWYWQSGNHDMAGNLYQKSIEAFERSCGPVSLHLISPLYARARVLKTQGRLEEAKNFEHQAHLIEQAYASTPHTYEYHGHYPRF